MSYADGRDNRFAAWLFSELPSKYDRLGWLLSMGQDRRWRAAIVEQVRVDSGARVLDVATGTAGVALALRAATGAEVVGIDLSAAMLEQARGSLAARNEHHVHLLQGHAEELPFGDDVFDAVTFTYLLRYVADPSATIRELVRVLRPGGVLAGMEFHVPTSKIWYPMWWCYTRLVLPIAGLLFGGAAWFEVGRFLGPNIARHYERHSVASTIQYWRDAGIADVHVRTMSLGGGLVMWGAKARDA